MIRKARDGFNLTGRQRGDILREEEGERKKRGWFEQV
jgi:hypothetical protein